MTHDQNKKTLRQFQCRDYLWEIFEQMSHELECSNDYLINEAMRQYARSRNYGGRSPSSPGMSQPPGPIPSLRQSRPAGQPTPPPPPPPQHAPLPQGAYGQAGGAYGQPQAAGSAFGQPPPAGGAYGQPASRPPPQPYGNYSAPQPVPAPVGRGPSSFPAPPPQTFSTAPTNRPLPVSSPPPLPGAAPARGPQPMPSLYAIFNGQKIPVNKAEFVIGRGSKTADLAIKDGNISRRHAAIVFENGAFFMKDLGSTNGVEFAGQRVDSKQIQEGDVFQLCDYELRFTYQ